MLRQTGMPHWAGIFQDWSYNSLVILCKIVDSYTYSLECFQEPKSLCCFGRNGVNMIVPLQRCIVSPSAMLVINLLVLASSLQSVELEQSDRADTMLIESHLIWLLELLK